MLAEAFSVHEPWLRTERSSYGEFCRDRTSLGGLIRGVDYVQAQRQRRVLCEEARAAMADLDLVVNVSVAGEAGRWVDAAKWSFLARPSHATLACLTGYPAISVCTGQGDGGLPVAMQLIAKPWAEPLLFRAAHAYQHAHGWHKQRPAIAR